MVRVKEGGVYQCRFGRYPHAALVGTKFGSRVRSADGGPGFVHVLQPTPELWTLALPHRTQILYHADIGFIVAQLDLAPGSVVVEAGPSTPLRPPRPSWAGPTNRAPCNAGPKRRRFGCVGPGLTNRAPCDAGPKRRFGWQAPGAGRSRTAWSAQSRRRAACTRSSTTRRARRSPRTSSSPTGSASSSSSSTAMSAPTALASTTSPTQVWPRGALSGLAPAQAHPLTSFLFGARDSVPGPASALGGHRCGQARTKGTAHRPCTAAINDRSYTKRRTAGPGRRGRRLGSAPSRLRSSKCSGRATRSASTASVVGHAPFPPRSRVKPLPPRSRITKGI